MGQRRKTVVTRDAAEHEMRDQEVLRANKELAAYFSGQRTEREARAALKVIKAFVRDRERRDAKSRPPLPGARATKTPKAVANRKIAGDRGGRRRSILRRQPRDTGSTGVDQAIEQPVDSEIPQSPASDDRTPE